MRLGRILTSVGRSSAELLHLERRVASGPNISVSQKSDASPPQAKPRPAGGYSPEPRALDEEFLYQPAGSSGRRRCGSDDVNCSEGSLAQHPHQGTSCGVELSDRVPAAVGHKGVVAPTT